MKSLTLRSRSLGNSTLIGNTFIDTFMVKANGDFVKVYLFLLRHINNPDASLTIPKIADCLEYTEKDILRALKYWEKTDLLSLEYDDERKIIGLEINPLTSSQSPDDYASSTPALPAHSDEAVQPSENDLMEPTKIKAFKNRKELKQLLFVAEQYLGKTLSKTDMDMICYFYDTLEFSADLVEYLIEYCVENNHKSMHYIQSVALAWSEANITTIDQAKQNSTLYNKNCYTVLKAFGISGRGPVSKEKEYVEKWIQEYGFTLDIITEACSRTVASIHQPSFEYTDTILTNWLEKNVHHMADIETIDLAYAKDKAEKKKIIAKPVTTNKFNNFQSRSYDLDSLEEQLLNTK
ncbi:MAG: DnaD domain protein [Lachnospiraceae bacterium]